MTNPTLPTMLATIAVFPTAAAAAAVEPDEASLSVTATVVRPVSVPASVGRDAPEFTLGETAALEVGAIGATVRRDGDRVVVTPGAGERITITLVY